MFEIRMAGLKIGLDNKYPFVFDQCQAYLADDTAPLDLRVCATDEEIDAELSLEIGADSREAAESICLYRGIAGQLYRFDARLMHGAVIGYKQKAYAFLAPSGTGKSTHISLWHRYLGDDVIPVNGDKPILRRQSDGSYLAYGTPWCGKEGQGVNAAVSLDGICLLSRGPRDIIRPLTPEGYVNGIIRQVVFPTDTPSMIRGAHLLGDLIRTVPAIAAECTPTENAVALVARALTE